MFTTWVGQAGSIGADGAGSAAQFAAPQGGVVDGQSNLYVADSGHHTIRKMSRIGLVSTVAGFAGIAGSTDGTGSAARFNRPSAVAVDTVGNLFVADTLNHTIRKITKDGIVSTLAGAPGERGAEDGAGSAARFKNPSGIAVNREGDVYVADTANHTIRKITQNGMVTTLAGSPGNQNSEDGTGTAARFFYPAGLAVDGAGHIYVADERNHKIRKITPDGAVSTLAGLASNLGHVDGKGDTARFSSPAAVAVDSAGHVYVADSGNNAVRKIAPDGEVTSFLKTGLNAPRGVVVTGDYALLVIDTGNSRILRKDALLPSAVRLAGGESNASLSRGSPDGIGNAAQTSRPRALSIDREGTLHLLDSTFGRLRKITSGRAVTTPFSSGSIGGSTTALALDETGNLYLTGGISSFLTKITPDGLMWSFSLTGSNQTQLASAAGIAVDSAQNIYLAGSNHKIYKLKLVGELSILAGPTNISPIMGSGDGTGDAARFNRPQGLAMDRTGHLYVADSGNHAIRKITPEGMVTTLAGVAGTTGGFADGTGRTARFNNPWAVAVDSVGNVFVADRDNHAIRKITPEGMVSTVGGRPGVSGTTDGTGSFAQFNSPVGIILDSAGNLYVADGANDTIRKGTPLAVAEETASFVRGAGSQVLVNSQFRVRLAGSLGQGPLVISASTDLRTWSPVFTNPPTISDIEFVDPSASAFPQRFYRVSTPATP